MLFRSPDILCISFQIFSDVHVCRFGFGFGGLFLGGGVPFYLTDFPESLAKTYSPKVAMGTAGK